MNSPASPSNGRGRVVAILAAATVAAASPGVARAAQIDEPFGQHVSECAKMSLGKRASPPLVTCSHDGHTHVFANFGEMVQQMRVHHGG